ncbi:MAG: hypothetical protein GF341_04425 [candidate division Zixibacteria bacterium]|nr:hypothetical protein [candidate division Zixibacteria bacterium]
MAVYYVDAATSNSDPTTVGTADDDTDPYGLQAAVDAAGAGDEVRCKNDATYTFSDTIDFDQNAGTAASPIILNGSNSSWTVDGTQVTFDFSGTAGGEVGFDIQNTLSSQFRIFNHFRLTGADSHGVVLDSHEAYLRWYNCRFDTNGGSGVYGTVDSGGIIWKAVFIDCEFDNNTGNGYGLSNDNRAGPTMIGCSVHDNTVGIELGSKSDDMMMGCVIYDNSSHGVKVRKTEAGYCMLRAVNCTIDGNGGNGFDLAQNGGDGRAVECVNTVISNNGGYGIDLNTESPHDLVMYLLNTWFYNNTGGSFSDSKSASDFWPGSDITTGTDPSFTNAAGDDFTLGASSGLIAAGFPGVLPAGGTGYMDIGALQREAGSGGGWGFQRRPRVTGA